MSEELKVDLCDKCNGACCKIFLLEYSKADVFKMLLGKHMFSKNFSKIEFLRILLWLKDLTNTPIGRFFREKGMDQGQRIYTCRKLSKKGKCTAYSKRLHFCYGYSCFGQRQLAHIEYKGKLILPKLNNRPETSGEVSEGEVSEIKCETKSFL
jgi:hypothetical protein